LYGGKKCNDGAENPGLVGFERVRESRIRS